MLFLQLWNLMLSFQSNLKGFFVDAKKQEHNFVTFANTGKLELTTTHILWPSVT